MIEPIKRIKGILPVPVRRQIRNTYQGLLDVQFRDPDKNGLPAPGWYIHPSAVSSRNKMNQFKNCHAGQRCFIIGNGPSLNRMDLHCLQNEITFGLNRIYLLFPKIGFQTTYYVSVNRLVIEQSNKDIVSLPMPKFISWYARVFLGTAPDIIYVRDAYDGTLDFAKNPTWQIWEGSTVTYVAMQLAFFMGFKQIILIGVDHSYSTTGEPHKPVIATGEDPNHFDPNYFGKGFRWQLPDLDTSTIAYRLAKTHFEKSGREIIDATLDGKLDVFRKVDFQSLF